MTTSKPAVATYLDPLLHKQLIEFKGTQQLRSLSQAIEVILSEYFGGQSPTCLRADSSEESNFTLAERVDRLAINYEFLNQSIFVLQQTLLNTLTQCSQTSTSSNSQNEICSYKESEQSVKIQSHHSEHKQKFVEIQSGLTGTDLALRLNTSSSTISRRKSKPSFQHWSRQLDPEGVAWTYSHADARYHPSDSSSVV